MLKTYRRPILGVLLLLALVGGVIAYARQRRQGQEVQKIKDKGTELAEASTQRLAQIMEQAQSKAFSPTNFFASNDEQRERWREFRQEVDKLPEEQRRQATQDMSKMFVKQLDKIAAELLAKPKQEQDQILDAFISLMELGRQRRATGNPENKGPPAARPPSSAEERDRRRREFLDNTSPVERARMSEGMRLLNQRRQERGLPPMRPRG